MGILPMIHGQDARATFHFVRSSKKAPRCITNELYEYMIVSEYDGSVVRQIKTIATGDGK